VELKHIKELMTVMSRTGTKRLKWKEGDFELTLERPDHNQPAVSYFEPPVEHYVGERFHPHAHNRADQALLRGAELASSSSMMPAELQQEDKNSAYVTSPMVGTFYASPSPSDPPFVKVGDRIEKNTVVCIIEAMKVMNEIKANVSGIVAEVLVEAGQPVEFGAKLFRITESS
jgi:acetyl-CoA carboxylase biotin carboxyl carrier protein